MSSTGFCLGGDTDLVDRILTTSEGREAFRAYIGYSGWGPGQLESEMQTGSWFTIPADPNAVFDKDPTRIWPDIVSTMGDDYRHYCGYAVRPFFELIPDPSRLSRLQPSLPECYACSDADTAGGSFHPVFFVHPHTL